MNTKIRLIQLGLTQRDLVKLLSEKNLNASPTEISLAINGRMTQNKHKKILKAVDEILTEMESGKPAKKRAAGTSDSQ